MECRRCGAALASADAACVACGAGAAPSESDRLPRGTVIGGKYEIVEPIGAGGMGRVYRAIQRPLGVDVCIKTLHASGTTDPNFLVRFEREARTTSQLRHPNIVSVTDFGTHTDGTLYLVMEFVQGSSLAEMTKGQRLTSAARATHILAQLCDALSAAHARGVIHRDIKPANVMLGTVAGTADFVKVLDFGSALMLEDGEEGERLTRVGTVIGTATYMAPEYILGNTVDARVDVYAVGTLLYRLLTGSTPFRGETRAVFAQQVSIAPERPRVRNPAADITEPMESVILRALAKDPARRYASAEALKVAMLNALAGVGEEVTEINEGAAAAAVEVAPDERVVVVVAVHVNGDMPAETVEAIEAAAVTHGAAVQRSAGFVHWIFGLDEDPAEAVARAIHAALDLSAHAGETPLRIGVHDAQVTLRGRRGQSDFRVELFGDGVTTLRALAGSAPAGRVLVSGAVPRHAPAELRLLPVVPPQGVREPVFLLTDALGEGRAGIEQPFVGREREQRALLEIAANAKAGSVCVVTGSEGVGKSRLVREVAGQAARLGVLWCVVPAGRSRQFGPAHPAAVIAALGWSAAGGGSPTERYAVDLMLGRAERDDGLYAERRLLRLVSAAIDGLARRLQQGPVVLVLDEMDAADDLTWELAQRLVDAASVLCASVVLCVRAQSDVPFELPAGATVIDLEPFSERETLALSRNALGAEAESDQVVAVASAARGIPLLVEESARAAARGDGAILGELGEFTPTQAIECLVAGRISACGPVASRVIAAAAVLGSEPDELELSELVGDAEVAQHGIADLHSAELLVRDAACTLRFPFPAARSAAFGAVSAATLASLHGRAAEILARSPGSIARAAEISEHLVRGGQDEAAYVQLRRAAEIARGEGESRRAARCLRLAMGVADRLGRAHDRLVAQRDLGRTLLQLGALGEAEELLRTGYADARAENDVALAADMLRLHGQSLLLQGDVATAKTEIEGTLFFAEKHGHRSLAADSCAALADVLERANESARVPAVLRRGLELIEGSDDAAVVPVRIQLVNRLGRCELQAGNLAPAIALFTQALDLAERTNDRYQAAGLLGNLGGAYSRKGEPTTAMQFTTRALQASERLGDPIGVARQSFNLAVLHAATGQTQSARQLLRSSFEAARRAGWREGLAMSTAALARLP